MLKEKRRASQRHGWLRGHAIDRDITVHAATSIIRPLKGIMSRRPLRTFLVMRARPHTQQQDTSQPLESISPSPAAQLRQPFPRDTGPANVGTGKFLLQNTHALALPNKASITCPYR